MLIDCDSCEVRDVACSDCVVTVLLGLPGQSAPAALDEAEQAAIGVLADSGLVPPLRLVASAKEAPTTGGTYDDRHGRGAARAG